MHPAVPDALVIDLTRVVDAEELHRLLQRKLGFPDFYGRNWNALWDAITGLVDLPQELTFTGCPPSRPPFGGSPRPASSLRRLPGRVRPVPLPTTPHPLPVSDPVLAVGAAPGPAPTAADHVNTQWRSTRASLTNRPFSMIHG
ncbi:barstar family protein [Streptomyces thermospinosisporus]|uniref:barstar family protein n=1 Tax=Streptomyces thermospinosisporus TaxID=161482 RepID=UPI0031DCE178